MTAAGIPALLEPIQNRLNAATPGPWHLDRDEPGEVASVVAYARNDGVTIGTYVADTVEEDGDAVFIANAPTDLTRLLAAVQAVTDLADAWQARGEHLKKSAETSPWDVQESLDEAGADFINNARLIRSAVVAALGGEA